MTNPIYLPFFQATRDVFLLMMDIETVACDANGCTGILAGEGISITIGLTGDVTGDIVYRFPKKTTLEMVRIMSGMDVGDIDDFVASAVGEIANIISGNAVVQLSENNINCDILPPRILVEGDPLLETLSADGGEPHTVIQSSIGEIELFLAVKNSVK